ncbi:MAG: hypothetical protein GKR88_17895 [Flavobacteriaceae bacterium]|nr:MAG: hypothetical protein GKR88_17895 [Flavobacteriaceae bacterium]
METRTHIDEPYVLKEEQIQFYNTYRYIKLKHVLDEDSLAYFNTIISEKVEALNQENTPLKNRSTYGEALLQLFNLWVNLQQKRGQLFKRLCC